MLSDIAFYVAGFLTGGCVVYVTLRLPPVVQQRRINSAEQREAIRRELSRVVSIEAVEDLRHQRTVALMRSGRRSQRPEANPNQPAKVHRMRRRNVGAHPLDPADYEPDI